MERPICRWPLAKEKCKMLWKTSRKEVIKTWSRRSTILPIFVGYTFAVHNGNKFIPVAVSEENGGS